MLTSCALSFVLKPFQDVFNCVTFYTQHAVLMMGLLEMVVSIWCDHQIS